MKWVAFLLLGAMLLAGCNTSPQANYDAVDLVEVSGTVTLGGDPLPDAVVKFEGPNGQYSIGKTDANGKYTLQFDSVKSGVTPGEKTVRISTAASMGEGEDGEESGEGETAPTKRTEQVPEKYNKKSELKKTVESGKSQTFDFALENK